MMMMRATFAFSVTLMSLRAQEVSIAQIRGTVTDTTGALGANGFGGDGPNALGAFIAEVLLTAAFVGVILLVTDWMAAPNFAGLAIGVTLTQVRAGVHHRRA